MGSSPRPSRRTARATLQIMLAQDFAELAYSCRRATDAFAGLGRALENHIEGCMDEDFVEQQMADFKPYLL